MKNQEELQMKVADVTSIIGKVISTEIEEIARGERVWVPLYRENRDLVGPGKPNSIDFPTKRSGIVWLKNISELTDMETQTLSKIVYSKITITTEKWGGIIQISRETLDRAQRDVIKETIFEAGEDFAEEQDSTAKEVAFGATAVYQSTTLASGQTTVSLGCNGSVSLLEIQSFQVSTVETTPSAIDYYDAKVKVAATTTGTEIKTSYVITDILLAMTQDAISGKEYHFKDLIQTRNKVIGKLYKPDVAVVHENELATLWFDPDVKFLDVSAYGKTEALFNAEIGKVGGLKILHTTRTYDGVVFYTDTRRLGRFVIKRPLDTHRKERIEIDGLEYIMYWEGAWGVINKDARAISTNHNTTYADKNL